MGLFCSFLIQSSIVSFVTAENIFPLLLENRRYSPIVKGIEERLGKEFPSYPNLEIHTVKNVRILTINSPTSTFRDRVADIHLKKEQKSFKTGEEVTQFAEDEHPELMTLSSHTAGHIISFGPHLINFGEGYLVDLTANQYFLSIKIDAIALPLPKELPAETLESYIHFAEVIFGGEWKQVKRKE